MTKKQVKKTKYRCVDCGKKFNSYGEASGLCPAPVNADNGYPHTVSAQEYFELIEDGSYDGKGPNEK